MSLPDTQGVGQRTLGETEESAFCPAVSAVLCRHLQIPNLRFSAIFRLAAGIALFAVQKPRATPMERVIIS